MIGIVPAPLGSIQWAKARPLIEASVQRAGDCTIEEVEAALSSIDKAQLWIAGDVELAAITQLFMEPTGKQCFIWHMGGNFGRWGYPMTRAAVEWARSEGCKTMELNARPGWQRRLPDWDVVTVTMRKVL